MADGGAGFRLLEGNTKDQKTFSDEKKSGAEEDPAGLLGKERTEEQDPDFVQTSLFDLSTEVLDIIGIEERALSGAFIKSSEIKSGSKSQESRGGAGCERVCEGVEREQRKRKLFSEAGIGPKILK